MIYICGDSFGVSDPDYGVCWSDLLAEQFKIINLAEVCASNLMIAQQVDRAIAANADYIIVLFTASTRGQTRYRGRVTPYSIHSLDVTTPFSEFQLSVLRDYTAEFFDLDLAIYQNQCIIESVLHRLQNSSIPFCFDQGGFEHVSYGGVGHYFQQYDQYRSSICLWDFATKRTHRPYYHITDPAQHRAIADYYTDQIQYAKT